jgi:hypothetical protein
VILTITRSSIHSPIARLSSGARGSIPFFAKVRDGTPRTLLPCSPLAC